jgi:U3 small nucleolar RNA-associated protein 22
MHPATAAFRYTEAWPVQPLPKNVAGVQYTSPLDVVMQLESSGAWPDDLQAIKAVRAAFYIHLAELIGQHLSLRTEVTAQFIDVWCEGFVFRLHIHHERELVLLERDDPEGKAARAIRKRNVMRPQHNSTLHGLYSRFPALGAAVRLAKIWVHSRTVTVVYYVAHTSIGFFFPLLNNIVPLDMFSGHISEETIELLVASVFARPAPFSAPLSPLIAFTRFIHLLAHYDWAHFALVVDFAGEMGRDGVRVAQEAFEQLQEAGKAPTMFIATPYDRTTSFWTKRKPARMVRLPLYFREPCLLTTRGRS